MVKQTVDEAKRLLGGQIFRVNGKLRGRAPFALDNSD